MTPESIWWPALVAVLKRGWLGRALVVLGTLTLVVIGVKVAADRSIPVVGPVIGICDAIVVLAVVVT